MIKAEHMAETFEHPVLDPDPIDEEEAVDGCPVVGIGASAGGLEAFKELLKNLPVNTGMAFVMVQHLDPSHESILAELLSGHTAMPVKQAVHGTSVEPNHVYVIPPNALMIIQKGVLRISQRESDRPRILPIDLFLYSLAEDQKSRAIGVILSGGASDGTIGLKAIKNAGGIAFAQDKTATFDSMPRNAIAAGVVDFILPPAAIARELAGIAQHSYLRAAASRSGIEDGPVLGRALALLRDARGVDFTHYKMPTLKRRIAKRMAVHHRQHAEAYLTLLEQDPSELNALFDDLLIHVTEFFRDPETFEALSKTVFPTIVKDRKPNDPIRIWIPGCASGEEVYSIAVCLTEYLEGNNLSFPVQLFGTDISDRAIEMARAGRYGEAIAAEVSPARLRRFFFKLESGGFQIARSVRDWCIFSRHDLTKDVPLSRMDLISCRNVLIYLGPILQRRVIATFSYALQPSGCLMLGHSETLGSFANDFRELDREHRIYMRHMRAGQQHYDFNPLQAPRPAAPHSPPKGEDAADLLDREADRVIAEEYGPSAVLVDAHHRIVRFHGNPGSYVAMPANSVSANIFSLVRPDILVVLRAAFDEAAIANAAVRKPRVQMKRNDHMEEIAIVVRPVSGPGGERSFLVLFEEQAGQADQEQGARRQSTQSPPTAEAGSLAEELTSTRAYLQSLIEELSTANEEAQSANEELQSTNEELQTAKEELQSSNEELTTTNDEMKSRNTDLSQLNNDLLNLLSSMQLPIVMLSKDLRIRRFTPLAEKALNLLATDIGRPVSDLKPRINVPDLEQLLADVIYSAKTVEREVHDQDGHWYTMRINPYFVAADRVEGAVLQLLDIDQLKRAVEAAQLARNYSEAILATTRQPLVVLDDEMRVQTANRSFFETFGVSDRETRRHSIFELADGQWNSPKIHQLLDELVSKGESGMQDVEIEHELKRVGRRTFQLSAWSLKMGARQSQILLALEDVTDRKRAAEAKYRRLFETAKDGILVIDPESGEITDINAFLIDLFGYGREELAGKRFWETPLMSRIPDGKGMLDNIRAEDTLRLQDISLVTRGGREIEIEAIGSTYTEGEKQFVQLNIRDITDRKLFDRRLQQTAKLESLGLLAGGVAHDFNNLLTGIMGNASLLLDNASVSSPDREFMREIVKSTQRAADLTRQMLAYSGQGRFVVESIDLSDLVREIASLIRSSIPRTVVIELHLAKGLPPIHADATQIRQLVMNLVINGAEAIGDGKQGSVRLTTREEQLDEESIRVGFPGDELKPGTYVSLEVADQGTGMDDATKAKIFDPFFTTKFTGRGLGLSAALGIVRGHHGAIRVDSVLGRGTDFKVFFPALAPALVPRRPPARRRDLGGTGHILLVDDEEAVLRPANAALARYGYNVLTAANGEEAVRLVRERAQKLDLVLLDLTMPVMGGEEAHAQIKAIRPELPVVLSSGYDEGQAVKRFGEQDLAGFIQKPYSVQHLLEVVKKTLRKTSAR
jgi:two-component system, chemotaxis family, CheB/CheR fusion protein